MATPIPDTFPNPGISRATLARENVSARCAIVDEACAFDVAVAYEPDAHCVTMEWFAAVVERLTYEPTTAEAFAVALREEITRVCAPRSLGVAVTHHEKGGVTLAVEAAG